MPFTLKYVMLDFAIGDSGRDPPALTGLRGLGLGSFSCSRNLLKGLGNGLNFFSCPVRSICRISQGRVESKFPPILSSMRFVSLDIAGGISVNWF